MKNLFLLIFVLGVGRAFSQNDQELVVKGRVVNYDGKPEKYRKVYLISSNGKTHERSTDSLGNYKFPFKEAAFISCTVTLDPKSDCKGVFGDGYIMSGECGFFYVGDSLKQRVMIKDFEIQKPAKELRIPQIIFKKNSLVFDTLRSFPTYYDSSDVFPYYAIKWLAKILKENPEIIIELGAHCSLDERDPQVLSQNRAIKVLKELIGFGISKERIKIKGYGCTKPLVSDSEIKYAKTPAGKETLRARNRRCTFMVLSWDFKPN